MVVDKLRDWLKTQISGVDSWSVGKIDGSKDKAVCLYENLTSPAARDVLGGGDNSYYTVNIKILVRFTNNSVSSDTKAREVYETVYNSKHTLNGKSVWLFCVDENPLNIGTDDKGIYESVINLKAICER